MILNLEQKILEEPVLIIAPASFPYLNIMREGAYQESFERFVERYDLIKENGCNVKVLGATNSNKQTQRYMKFLKDFEKVRKESLVRWEVNCNWDHKGILWPRDVFQTYENLVAVYPHFEKKVSELLPRLGKVNPNIEFISSEFGQGGFVVRDKKTLIVSEFIKDEESDIIQKLKEKGFDINFLPVPKTEHRSSLEVRMSKNSHIDTEFNMAFSPEGNALFCVNGAYYSAFRDEVDTLIKKFDGRLHIIKENTYEQTSLAVNFIKLPNGKIIMPNDCPITQEFLEKGLGKGNVLTPRIDCYNDYSAARGISGGLRCMSNLIY